MQIKTAIHADPNEDMVIEDVELAEPRDDEILVKVTACGVCHTDLWIRQYAGAPMVLGHEVSGIVEKTGRDVRRLRPGDPVALSHTYCGKCAACKDNRTYDCVDFDDNFSGWRQDGTSPFSLDGTEIAPLMRLGGFSTYTVCHENAATKVDPDIDLRLLGPLGCGIMTGAGSVFNHLKPVPGRPIAIFGTGTVGLSAVMAAKIAGSDPIIAIDRIPERLALARTFGATHTLNSEQIADLSGEIQAICAAHAGESDRESDKDSDRGRDRDGDSDSDNDRGNGVDYAFDTSGNQTMLSVIREVLNRDAKACGVGIGGYLSLTGQERNDGKTWVETKAGFAKPQVFLPKLIAYYKEGRFPFDKMIRFFPFEEINEAFEANASGTAIKPVLLME